MGQAARAAYAAAYARHALNKVGVSDFFTRLHKRNLAGFNAVAGNALKLEIGNILLLKSLRYRVGKTAAAGKYSAEVGGVVKHILRKLGYFKVAAVKQRL